VGEGRAVREVEVVGWVGEDFFHGWFSCHLPTRSFPHERVAVVHGVENQA
jgi:hypothetical protein